MLSPLLGNAPLNAIVFGAKGNATRFLESNFPRSQAAIDSGRPCYWRGALGALWAGWFQCLVAVPVELIKCRLQVQQTPIVKGIAATAASTVVSPSPTAAASSTLPSSTLSASAAAQRSNPQYLGTWDCARQIYRSQGIRGLYHGWWVTVWRDAPAYAAWFLAYDYSRVVLMSDEELRSKQQPKTWVTLTAGSVAGIATWISTYPFDVIKSIIQTAPSNTPKHELKIMHVARVNYQKHGFGFFWKGLSPTLLRAVPVSAVTFYVYELCLDLFKGRT